MKVAIICPTGSLGLFAVQGNIHLVLTRLVLEDKNYREFYRKETKYKILDNSLFEEGIALGDEEVWEAAQAIKADEIVLRDTLYDGCGTIESTKRSINFLKRKSAKQRLMAVVQGSTIKEWLNCYKEIVKLRGVDVIGLSKLSIPKSWNLPISIARYACCKTLVDLRLVESKKEYHLLGGSNLLLWELAKYKEDKLFEFIRSVDSSVSVGLGQSLLTFADMPAEKSYEMSYGDVSEGQQACINGNIKALLGAAK